MSECFHLKTNFLEYHRVEKSIQIFLNNFNISKEKIPQPFIPNQIQLLLISKKGCKDFYKILTNSRQEKIVQNHSTWAQKLQIEINFDMWKIVYKACFKTLQDNDLIWMQYRILNNILGNKAYQYKVKITSDPSCTLCKQHDETNIHLFVTCPKVKSFWETIEIVNLLINRCKYPYKCNQYYNGLSNHR